MKKMLTLAGVSVMALSLGTGVASAHGGGVTGPDSSYNVDVRERFESRVNNHNVLQLRNNTDQDASSGNAVVRFNTSAGDASTGDVKNDNLTNVEADIRNNSDVGGGFNFGGGGWNIDGVDVTGPGSDVDFDYRRSVDLSVNNDNYIDVNNDTRQYGHSGDATVRYNTFGGDARTGDVTNWNTTGTSVRIEN